MRDAFVSNDAGAAPAFVPTRPGHWRVDLFALARRRLAALGVQAVSVARRPRIAIITTGRELVDDPAQPLESGEIRNSNGPFLAARAIEATL